MAGFQKNWMAGPPGRQDRWIQFAQFHPPPRLWRTNHAQDVSVWCSGDGCLTSSILFKYERGKGHLYVLSWARVRRVARGSAASE